ncbi:uncharacterized protein [Rutidosis leptorrhynchoides]|uniref:uncharacterized protein n=1 Tax=Rutidosis leptorrhynchoides TaxID=125765 RepID=UPI003A992CBE
MKSIFAYRNNVVIRREVEEQNEAQSSRRKRRYISRDRVEAHNRLMNDYFVQDPKYPPEYFKRRYRMSQSLLEKIIEGILSYSTRPDAPKWFTYFQQRRLYHKHEELHGFPGMLGSIDCMHWAWEKCPNAWKGHFTRGDHGYPTIMLEAVASLLTDRGYYLADVIYPSWASFVKGFSSVVDAKRKYFTKKQSAARKDVERTFGILQGRWGILRQPARAYSVNKIKRIMYGCIILHNMIIEDNGVNIAENKSYYLPVNNLQGSTWYERCDVYAEKTKELRDKDEHGYLRHTLVSHLWHNRDDEIVNEL